MNKVSKQIYVYKIKTLDVLPRENRDSPGQTGMLLLKGLGKPKTFGDHSGITWCFSFWSVQPMKKIWYPNSAFLLYHPDISWYFCHKGFGTRLGWCCPGQPDVICLRQLLATRGQNFLWFNGHFNKFVMLTILSHFWGMIPIDYPFLGHKTYPCWLTLPGFSVMKPPAPVQHPFWAGQTPSSCGGRQPGQPHSKIILLLKSLFGVDQFISIPHVCELVFPKFPCLLFFLVQSPLSQLT